MYIPFTKNKIEKFTEKVNKFLNEDAENEINCSYLDVEELNLKTASKLNKSFSVFHLNISSLPYHFDELEELLKQINIKFDIVGITESKLKKTVPTPIKN